MRDFMKYFKTELVKINSYSELKIGDTVVNYNPLDNALSMFKFTNRSGTVLASGIDYYRVMPDSDDLGVGSYVLGTDGVFYMRIMYSDGSTCWFGVSDGQEVYEDRVDAEQILYEA